MSGKRSHEKGSESEAVVLSRLKAHGLTVSIPWGRPRYDMVVDLGDEMLRAQVKTARKTDTSITFECRSSHINSGGNKHMSYTEDEIDIFLVYSPETDYVYWIDVEDAPKTAMSLRVDEPSKYTDTKQMNWHENYLLTAAI